MRVLLTGIYLGDISCASTLRFYIDYMIGGSGFIAAHVLDVLLEHGHSVVTTVRSQAKAQKIREAKLSYGKDKLDFAIVEDIAQPDGN